MSIKFNMIKDIAGYNGFGLPFYQGVQNVDNYQCELQVNVVATLTIPSNYAQWLAVFSYEPGAVVWVACNNTATLAGASFAATTSQLLPSARLVYAGDILSFITEDTTADVGVSLYAIS